MVDSQTTSSIRFNNLSLLLKNMKSLKMVLGRTVSQKLGEKVTLK